MSYVPSVDAQLRDRPSGTALVVPQGAGGSQVSVGRARDCDVVLGNYTVSRHHAVLRHDGRTWLVEDLGSKNGTAVNGVPVTRAPVESGDIVGFGMTAVRFVATERA
jgi:pSer/pThr/pTyr-binding forkhead associated (FHA) protein